MGNSHLLSSEHVTLVDTNVFISIGNPETSKYRQFRQVVRRAEVTLLVPPRIEQEIEQSGVKPALERAQKEGWAEVVESPTISYNKATTAQDIVRRTIASKSAEKDEHTVEKADSVFAGFAVEYLHDTEQPNYVTVITTDRIAQEAIETAMTSLGYGEQISIISLWDLIDIEDDDYTLI